MQVSVTVSAVNEHEFFHPPADRIEHGILVRHPRVIEQRDMRCERHAGAATQADRSHRRTEHLSERLEPSRPLVSNQHERPAARSTAKADAAIEHGFERRQAHPRQRRACLTDDVIRQAAEKQQRHMQPLTRCQLAGKSVRALKHAREPNDAVGRNGIGYSSQEQVAAIACVSIHDRIERIMNI
jgi:hypothetical protein